MKPDTILVIEDEEALRRLLETLFRGAGYAVATAADGRQALDYLARAEPPRVILLDLRMPVLDGWGFRRQQLEDPRLAAIPVVVVASDADAARDAGWFDAAAYLLKPVAIEQLLRAVRGVVRGDPTAAAL
jgi:CheY-like chemotaxis protein